MNSIQITSDHVDNVHHSKPHPLDVIFVPKTIAVIGASERKNSIGHSVLWNLINNSFGDT